MLVSNHQATDSKKDICTKIVLESADPYLPDRVEFKHTSLLNIRQDMSSRISDAARGWAGWALAILIPFIMIIEKLFALPKLG